MNNISRSLLLVAFIAIITIGCNDQKVYVPKPRMYPKVNFPALNRIDLKKQDCDLSFEYPDYLIYKQDSFKFEGNPVSPCWFDLQSDDLNLSLHCSYYPITSTESFDKLVDDSFKITGKHNSKASARRESLISKGELGGILFEVDGPVASPLQFYITDSTEHFFRASFYFDAKVDQDSTKVVYDFVREDIDHLIETFQFK